MIHFSKKVRCNKVKQVYYNGILIIKNSLDCMVVRNFFCWGTTGDYLGTTDTKKRLKAPKDIKSITLNMLIYQGL